MVCERGSIFTVWFYKAEHQPDQDTRRYLGKLTEFPQCMQSTAQLADYFLILFFQRGIDYFVLLLDLKEK